MGSMRKFTTASLPELEDGYRRGCQEHILTAPLVVKKPGFDEVT